MSSALDCRLSEKLRQRTELGLLRQAVARSNDQLLDFSSNDYLGLRQHPDIANAFTNAAAQGVGAGASHLLGGHTRAHDQLAQALCEWTGREAAALFASGFQAALGAFSALVDGKDLVVADRLAHACLLDGARHAGAALRRFAHNDVQSAQELLSQNAHQDGQVKWLVSESIFSMDGDQAPVLELAALAAKQEAALMIDEAHAIGVLGREGCGLVADSALSVREVPVLMITFGKALGSAGAAILGSRQTIAAIENFSRPYIYTTAMPDALAIATTHAITVARAADDRRTNLLANIQYFRKCAMQLGISLGDSIHAIQPALIGHERVVAISQALLHAGIYAPAVRTPTVPTGQQRLRISLNALHRKEQIEVLLETLAQVSSGFS